MANENVSRGLKFNEKRESRYMCVELSEAAALNAMNGEITAVSQNYLIGRLPANALITNAYVFTKTASNAATTAVATLGTAEAGTQIMSAGNLKTLGKTGTFTAITDTSTGVNVYLGIVLTGAATPVGKYVVVIEYLEYKRSPSQEYTPATV